MSQQPEPALFTDTDGSPARPGVPGESGGEGAADDPAGSLDARDEVGSDPPDGVESDPEAGASARADTGTPADQGGEPADQGGEPADQGGDPAGPDAPGRSRRITIAVALLVFVAAAGLAVVTGIQVANLLEPDLPTVGDCLDDPTGGNPAVVDCAGPEAVWRVVGHDGEWVRTDFDAADNGEVCRDQPGTEQALWVTRADQVSGGTVGEVMCLAPVAAAGDG